MFLSRVLGRHIKRIRSMRQHGRLTGCTALIVTCWFWLPVGSAAAQVNPADGEFSDPQLSGPELSAQDVAFFETNIRPVLIEHCYRCHSEDADQIRGGLVVDSRDGMHLGGDSGPSIVPGDLDASLLFEAINYDSVEMPPERQLPEDVIDDFREWILMGAPDPRVSEATLVVRSNITAEDIEAGRSFWAYAPPVRPEYPSVNQADWVKNDIDRFILAELEQAQLAPNDDAEPHQLLRRLSFDLTGLPPGAEQSQRFLSTWQSDPDRAIADLVDELLASEAYGERWGRHWLDVARYAESSGKEINVAFPYAWRYRDYVIDSFNDDKPYDEFIRQQIAGDLLVADSDEELTENLIATGFLALGPKPLTERNPRQFTADMIDEQIDTTTRVIMGVSVSCARCHDHKFDPIPQSDYYAMAGIFLSTETFYGTIGTLLNRRPGELLEMPVPDDDPVRSSVSPRRLDDLRSQLAEAQQELEELRRERRRSRSQRNRNNRNSSQGEPEVVSTRQLLALSNQVTRLEATIASYHEDGTPISFLMGVQPVDRPREAQVLLRGELENAAQFVDRGLIQVINHDNLLIPEDSIGRLELAEWMVSDDHPLTARVMVNRIWLHLMGEGLVRTPENFGSSGQPPTHPELLDYLALEFIESEWSIKDLIRQIALSRSYRMSTEHRESAFQADPENQLHWRANPRRLDAEEIRDAMLFASGQLQRERPNGSPITQLGDVVINERTIARIDDRDGSTPRNGPRRQPRGRGAREAADSRNHVRSIYLPVLRDQLPHSLSLFDFAEPSMVVGQRDESNTPSQALYLMNNPFVMEQCDAMALRIVRASQDPDEQVRLAFELIYNRPPSTRELRLSRDYLTDAVADARDARRPYVGALSSFCQALFASGEFRYLD